MEPTCITPDFSQAHMRLASEFGQGLVPLVRGKKAARRDARTAAAIAAGRTTFTQLREEAAAQNPDRYAFRNLGTRKTGMLGTIVRQGK